MDKQNKRRVLRNFLGGRDNCVACPTMVVSSASNADRYSRICLLKYCYEMISYRNNRDSVIKCLGVKAVVIGDIILELPLVCRGGSSRKFLGGPGPERESRRRGVGYGEV